MHFRFLLSISQKDNVKVFILLFGEMNIAGYKPVDVASEYAASELKHKNIWVCQFHMHNVTYTHHNVILSTTGSKTPSWPHWQVT